MRLQPLPSRSSSSGSTGLSTGSAAWSLAGLATAGLLLASQPNTECESTTAEVQPPRTPQVRDFKPQLGATNLPNGAGYSLVLEWFEGWGGKTLLRTNGPITGPLFREWREWCAANTDSTQRQELQQCFTLIRKHWGEYNKIASAQFDAIGRSVDDVVKVRAEVDKLFPDCLSRSARWLVGRADQFSPMPWIPLVTPESLRRGTSLHSNVTFSPTVPVSFQPEMPALSVRESDLETSSHVTALSNHMAAVGWKLSGLQRIVEYAQMHLHARGQLAELDSSFSKLSEIRVKGEGEFVDLDVLGKNGLICRGFAPEAHFMLSLGRVSSLLIVGELKSEGVSPHMPTGHAFVFIPERNLIFDPSATHILEAFRKVVQVKYDSTNRLIVVETAPEARYVGTSKARQYTFSRVLQLRGDSLHEISLDILAIDIARKLARPRTPVL